jgi:hypothetical protein
MFRSTHKKRSKAATRVRVLDDNEEGDDEEGNANALNIKKKREKKKRGEGKRPTPVAAAFPYYYDDGASEVNHGVTINGNSNREESSKRKKAKTSGGLGFGGAFVDGQPGDERDSDLATFTYDRNTLSKLMAEQQQSMYARRPSDADRPQEDTATSQATPYRQLQQTFAWEQPSAASSLQNTQRQQQRQQYGDSWPSSQPFPDFLPLKNTTDKDIARVDFYNTTVDEPTILTGAEALSFMQEQNRGDSSMGSRVQPDDLYETDADVTSGAWSTAQAIADNTAWEAEVTRRAGLLPSADTENTTMGGVIGDTLMVPTLSTDGNVGSGTTRLHLLDQLQVQIQGTLEQLNEQQRETGRRIQRREGEVQASESTILRHERELKETGTVLEFYQRWRNDLCQWAGALRDLRLKVEPVLEALHELQGEKAALQRWRDWEDDSASVLREHGMLERVIGRQPETMAAPIVLDVVDEFGRDIKSQHVMHREKRLRHRQRIHQQRLQRLDTASVGFCTSPFVRDDESDAFVSDGEEEMFRSRHKSLQKALALAMEELEEKYTWLHSLFDMFEEWRKLYPDEYKECFASLSLADLASILVQTELCSLNDPWNESEGYNEAKWTAVVHGALEAGTMDQPAVERLFEKSVLPAINDILDKEGINLVSVRQTRSFATFVSHLQKLLPNESNIWNELDKRLTAFVEKTLLEIAIPLVRKETNDHIHVPDENVDEVDEARNCAWGQLYRIKRVLINLLAYWAPIVKNDEIFVEVMLQFMSNQFLFLLSSLKSKEQDPLAESTADVFGAVYKALSPTGWLDFPENITSAAPIRAAAAAFGIECVDGDNTTSE